MGYMYAIASLLSFSTTSTIQKHISLNIDLRKALFLQYLVTTLFSGWVVFFFDSFIFSWESGWKLLLLFAVIGYLGIWSLLKGFKHLPMAVVVTVSYLYVFLAFFLQHYLLSGSENLSMGKIIISLAFFFVTCFFLFEHTGEKWSINKYVIFPILTALSWAIYYSLCNYGVKAGIFTPFQMTFYSELPILIFAGIISIPIYLKKNETKISQKSLLTLTGSWFFTFLGALFLNNAYGSLNGNIVNIISLATIVIIPLLAYLFYQEKLNRKDILLIGASLFLLCIFQIVP